MYDSTDYSRPPTRSTNAMVATPHTLASNTGVDLLRAGGSAVDAAIGINAVLAAAYPHMAGLGGDGFWLLAPPNEGVRGINASGPAATAATREFYAHDDEIPERGPAAALTVPGAVDGWRLAHDAYGQLPWERLFEDAIDLAADGVPVTANLAQWIRRDRDVLASDDWAAGLFMPGGDPLAAGERLHQSDLAGSLSTLASDGPRAGFYEGGVASGFCSEQGAASPLAPEDFATYRAEWVDPLSVDYRGYTAHTLPPNTQGLAALQLLGLLEGFDVAAWGDGTATYHHRLTEATKLAFADRDAWITDPDRLDIPTDRLLTSDYLRQRRELISGTAMAPDELDPGIHPPDRDPVEDPSGGDTCYFAVVDESGLAVSAIQSIYFDFGAGVVAGDTGIVPQNRGAYFSLDPASVNTLEPGKRPFHTLIPAMLTKDGEPWLLYGTMGGEGQPQTQAALVTRLVDFGYDVQQAISAPRWLYGRTWGATSRSLSLEKRVSDGVVSELEDRGHTVSIARGYDEMMGHAQAIRIHENGTLSGGADPRGDGSANGY